MLHPFAFMDPSGRLNAYQQAIMEVGEVIKFYNSDRRFLAWGFGGRTYDGSISHCFNLNGGVGCVEVMLSGLKRYQCPLLILLNDISADNNGSDFVNHIWPRSHLRSSLYKSVQHVFCLEPAANPICSGGADQLFSPQRKIGLEEYVFALR
ncbi:hypothetical protein RHMOL_Rhmol07G0226200 [Rhododendron molle]|uniref:Uncharacterized protein n=1 Tax=Rhododendron molle TaxID=49168 RepID=A0ACC0N3Y7_RHOML|nr:hypothetical protein RHMOL_Rhmol07G0226200 [Rhododendron molle]